MRKAMILGLAHLLMSQAVSGEEGSASSGAVAGGETAQAEAPKKEKTPKIEQNGVVRPKVGTLIARIWDFADAKSKELGEPVKRAVVLEALEKEGLNPATIATQYGKWRKFHGLKGIDETAKAAKEAEKAAKKAQREQEKAAKKAEAETKKAAKEAEKKAKAEAKAAADAAKKAEAQGNAAGSDVQVQNES